MLACCPPDMPLRPPSHQPNPPFCLPSLCSCSPLKIRLQCHPHLCPHHFLRFSTPAAYNPYAPTRPSIYAYDTTLNPPYTPSHSPNPL
ncbi:hypothetical protein O181_011676 [Austropuccinia psidii MF-1]|uniref:Uncharacterized protein n=1 Tax=Austropuccinia psidii MF-1 TaxID=1389203 RepID=A0A9Q3BT74_9BASI|nr:hypothetical protein [Austropuccinia psidii MF-1]